MDINRCAEHRDIKPYQVGVVIERLESSGAIERDERLKNVRGHWSLASGDGKAQRRFRMY